MTDPLSHGDEERAAQALIAAAGKVLADDPPRRAARVRDRAVRARRARRPHALRRARDRRACGGRLGRCLRSASPGRASVRLASPEPAAAHERLKAISVLEIVNDDMPFLVDSVMGELAERGLDVRLVVHPIFAVERDAAGRLRRVRGRAAGRARRGARKLHPYPPRAHRRRGAAQRDRRGDRGGARRRARQRAGLARDARPGRRSDRRAQGQSAAAAGRRDRRGRPVPGMARATTISPSWACATTSSPPARMRSIRYSRAGSASCAPATCTWCSAGTSRS